MHNMTDFSSLATSMFAQGFNCAQSVLYACGREYFKEDASALKLASGFAAGISYRGELCGAVSGALMAIGLHHGYADQSQEARDQVFSLTKRFLSMFETLHGSVHCNQLLETDISTPEGLQQAREKGAFKSKCPLLVGSAAQIVGQLLAEEEVK